MKRRVPVILDTDIGGDIDDTWAVALMLRCPEIDVRLIVSDSGDTEYRARIIARLLETAGRTDIPVGVGLRQNSDGPRERQAGWVADYPLKKYPGKVSEDGVAAIVRTIMDSAEPVTLVAIGPVPNIAEALRREPRIAAKARYVAMAGSIAQHHKTNLEYSVFPGAIAEWNVVADIPSAQQVFAAPWQKAVIMPLDTCAHVVLAGARYEKLMGSSDPMMRAVFENYRMWSANCKGASPDLHSTVLYDTVAVHLAYTTRFLEMKEMRLVVDDKGFTKENAAGRPIQVAISWRDLEGYYDDLAARLLGEKK